MELEVGDIVLCTVERIERTIVFVKIHFQGKEIKGSIVMSEIAPGRIRNIRQYVVPKKKIVCKVLRISENRIELSLRRVTQKEKKEIIEQHKEEKRYIQVLKSILGEKSKQIIKEIENKETVYEFLEKAKTSPQELEKITSKKEADKILQIINTEKKKKSIIKKEFIFKSNKPDGLEIIKNTLNTKDAKIKYISAGHYIIKLESKELKKASQKINEILEEIRQKAKKQGAEFSIIEKK